MIRLRTPSVPKHPVPAVVLGGENGALPIVRSLAMGGLKSVVVASERPDDPTFRSRYCTAKVVLERFDPSSDERNLRTLVGLARLLDERPVLFWGSDREVLGSIAAQIRALRPPEPYKGKGIKYAEEKIRRKSGKAAGAA